MVWNDWNHLFQLRSKPDRTVASTG